MPTWIARGPGIDWLTAIASRISALVSQCFSVTSSFSIRPHSATGPPKPKVPRRRKYKTSCRIGTRAGVASLDIWQLAHALVGYSHHSEINAKVSGNSASHIDLESAAACQCPFEIVG